MKTVIVLAVSLVFLLPHVALAKKDSSLCRKWLPDDLVLIRCQSLGGRAHGNKFCAGAHDIVQTQVLASKLSSKKNRRFVVAAFLKASPKVAPYSVMDVLGFMKINYYTLVQLRRAVEKLLRKRRSIARCLHNKQIFFLNFSLSRNSRDEEVRIFRLKLKGEKVLILREKSRHPFGITPIVLRDKVVKFITHELRFIQKSPKKAVKVPPKTITRK